jgi:hypothetical protein
LVYFQNIFFELNLNGWETQKHTQIENTLWKKFSKLDRCVPNMICQNVIIFVILYVNKIHDRKLLSW